MKNCISSLSVVFLFFSLVFAGTRSNLLSNHVVVSSYKQKVISRSGYDYAPTIMKENGLYKMWWCGNPSSSQWDYIYYATSINGITWSIPQVVMSPAPLALTSDPSIVRVGSTYYMYFTGTWNSNGNENDIYLATSSDGITWTKYPDNNSPVAVLPRSVPNASKYGCGQPSVMFLNNQFVAYFLDQGTPDGMYRATSSDGMNFGNRAYIMSVNDVDIKYSTTQNCFIMLRSGQYDNSRRVYLHISYDGYTFTPVDNVKYIPGPPSGESRTISCGIAGDMNGLIENDTLVYYSVGNPDQYTTWDIHASTLNVFYHTPNLIFRYRSPNTKSGDHYYTLNPNTPPYYDYEQVAWISPKQSDPSAVFLYRLYHSTLQDHFYTADINERNNAVLKYGYDDEGYEGYILKIQTANAVPLYRLVHPKSYDHLYTTSYDELRIAINKYGYRYELIAGYVFPY